MANIASALARIKLDVLRILDRELIERICREHHLTWRDRELDPATTIALFVQQVVHGNIPCSEVRHLGGGRFSAQAYCEARARLPREVYQALLYELYQRIVPCTHLQEYLWHGHRTFHIERLDFLHARHAAVAQGLRHALGPKGRMRLSGGTSAGAVQRRHRHAHRHLGVAVANR